MSFSGKPLVQVEAGETNRTVISRSGDHRDIYANNIRAGMTPWDIALHFGIIIDASDSVAQIEERATIRLSPQTMKVLVAILPSMMEQWERQFGKVPLPDGLVPESSAIRDAFTRADVAAGMGEASPARQPDQNG